MALDATHIKFALDIKKDLKVKNLSDYLSGTLYPDSRYFTNTKREKTHDGKIIKAKNKDDFKKGLAVHLICDSVANEVMFQQFPKILLREHDADWHKNLTAIKLVQDALVLKKFDINKYLPLLRASQNPNGESKKDLNKYYNITKKVYKNSFNFNNMKKLLVENGLDKKFVEKIINQTKVFFDDKKMIGVIDRVYNKMISLYKKI